MRHITGGEKRLEENSFNKKKSTVIDKVKRCFVSLMLNIYSRQQRPPETETFFLSNNKQPVFFPFNR